MLGRWRLLLTLILVPIGGCFYDVDRSLIPDDDDTDTGSDLDAGGDGGGASGLGEPCTADADCAGFDASYCALDPISGAGQCTIADCPAQPCPEGYTCCDCSSMGYPQFCVDDGSLAQIGAVCDCG